MKNTEFVNKTPDFDPIAAGWYNFRHYTIFKDELDRLSMRWGEGKLLNAGCGHGADFLPFKEAFQLYGIDISLEMLKQAERYFKKHNFHAELKQADIRLIPYQDDDFDNAIAVASLHHIKDYREQLKAVLELKRVVKPGGEIFITVWNALQPRFWLTRRDTFIPWKNGDQTVYRYYHLFTYREIEKLVLSAGLKIVSINPESKYKGCLKHLSRNICLLLRVPHS